MEELGPSLLATVSLGSNLSLGQKILYAMFFLHIKPGNFPRFSFASLAIAQNKNLEKFRAI